MNVILVLVYNFHVKKWASYFAGEVSVYVHNGRVHKLFSDIDDKLMERIENHVFSKKHL